jgi:hypothetical protein
MKTKPTPKQIIKVVKTAFPSVIVLDGKQAVDALAMRDRLRAMGLL